MRTLRMEICHKSKKIITMNLDGSVRKEGSGKIYHILVNDNSCQLLKDEYKGKEVIIIGIIYPDENIVEIDFVKLAPMKK